MAKVEVDVKICKGCGKEFDGDKQEGLMCAACNKKALAG